MSTKSRFIYGGGQDIEVCGCGEALNYLDKRIDLEFCSKKCADIEVENRIQDAEFERQMEIKSGGQS